MNYLFEVRNKKNRKKIKVYGTAFHPMLGPAFIIFEKNQFLFDEVNQYIPIKESEKIRK